VNDGGDVRGDGRNDGGQLDAELSEAGGDAHVLPELLGGDRRRAETGVGGAAPTGRLK
jgi:hypothetical protein